MKIQVDTPRFLEQIATDPGVYQFFNVDGVLLYVGKAKNLRKRVSSYFIKHHTDAKTRVLVKQIAHLSITLVQSEGDALLLENNLIKQNRPRYNILLKDDKTYPWICIRNEPFPRVFLTRKRFDSKDLYFGPYPKATTPKILLGLIREMYPLRTCALDLSPQKIAKKKYNVCLEYHLKRCFGPCVGHQNESQYQASIDEIKLLLSGKTYPLIQKLKHEMQIYSDALAYEEAQACKVKLQVLDTYYAKSAMVNNPRLSFDVLTLEKRHGILCFHYAWVREGRIDLSISESTPMPLDETLENTVGLVWIALSERFKSDAREIVTNVMPSESIEGVQFSIPQKGDKYKILAFSIQNLTFSYREVEQHKKEIDFDKRVESLFTNLRLPEKPLHIECFDNSNIQGTNPVAACVVFRNGAPSKEEYRHYNVKSVSGPDDFASMREIVFRRYERQINEQKSLPNLIVIDGGKGQLSAALEALEALSLRGKVPIIGLAKKLEEVFFPGDTNPIHLKKDDPALFLLQHIRNEAHRFGITFHRNQRSKNFMRSEFLQLPGIGEKTAQKIQKSFPTLTSFWEVSEAEQDAKLGKTLANKIRKSNP